MPRQDAGAGKVKVYDSDKKDGLDTNLVIPCCLIERWVDQEEGDASKPGLRVEQQVCQIVK